MEFECKSAVERFSELTKGFRGMDDVLESISHLEAQNRLDEVSEIYLLNRSGWGRAKVREVRIILESFGFMVIEQGKVTAVNKGFKALAITDDSVLDVVKNHITSDEKAQALASYISNNTKVGDKVPSERDLKKHLLKNNIHIGREKLREILLRLECGGYLYRKNRSKRVLLKPINEVLG